MKIYVDKEACIGCGLCVDTLKDIFAMKEYVAVVKVNIVPENLIPKVKQMMLDCPMEAIKEEE
jgi:ferredoxin